MEPNETMQKKGRRSVLTGGLILITLGVLIILSKMGIWGFGQSWPLLLIVIAVGHWASRSGTSQGGSSAAWG